MRSFDNLAGSVFALDPGVRWVAVKRPGEPPQARYRSNVVPLNGAASDEAEARLVNLGILALAHGRGDWDLNGLRYVVLAYGKLTQLVAPLAEGGHVSLSLDREADATDIGDALMVYLVRGEEPHRRRTASELLEAPATAGGRGDGHDHATMARPGAA